MGVAHVVDVRTLHQEDLALHLLMRDGMPTGGIRLMAVRPLELHGLMIDVEVATSVPELILISRCLADLDLTEARIDGRTIQQRLPRLIIELGDQDIAVRSFCRPERRALERKRRLCRAHRGATPFGGSHGSTAHLIGVERQCIELVAEAQVGTYSLRSLTSQLRGDTKTPLLEVGGHIGDDLQVTQVHLRLSGEVDRTEDPWEAEHILCFEERAITIAVDLYSDDILLSLGAEVR